jgi:hypothetical protein
MNGRLGPIKGEENMMSDSVVEAESGIPDRKQVEAIKAGRQPLDIKLVRRHTGYVYVETAKPALEERML